jgi:hypothetical protein
MSCWIARGAVFKAGYAVLKIHTHLGLIRALLEALRTCRLVLDVEIAEENIGEAVLT